MERVYTKQEMFGDVLFRARLMKLCLRSMTNEGGAALFFAILQARPIRGPR
jgi:hypothetical protein